MLDQHHQSPSLHAETRRLTVNGIDMAYRRFGHQGETPPLVLLQRFRGTMDHWDPALIDALASDREVIIFDTVGVGASQGVSPASVHGMADNAAAFIQALNLGPVDILGWSLGGITTFSLLLHHADLVRRAVIAAATPGGVDGARPAPQKVWEVAAKPVNDDEDFLYLFYEETPQGRQVGQRQLDRLNTSRADASPAVSPETVKAQFAALMATREADAMLEQLAEVKTPVLIANGVNDIMVHSLASFAAAERMTNATCIIYPASGHGFLFQYAERFAADVTRFLDADIDKDHGV